MSLKSRVFKASAEVINSTSYITPSVTPTAHTFQGQGTSVERPKCSCGWRDFTAKTCICIPTYDSAGNLVSYGPPVIVGQKPNAAKHSEQKETGISLPLIILDENLLMDAFNRAVAKHPKDFVELIDTGSIYYKQCKHVIFELGLMGYCIMEDPFEG